MIATKRYSIEERVFPMSFYLIGGLFGRCPFLRFNLPSAGFSALLEISQVFPILTAPPICPELQCCNARLSDMPHMSAIKDWPPGLIIS